MELLMLFTVLCFICKTSAYLLPINVSTVIGLEFSSTVTSITEDQVDGFLIITNYHTIWNISMISNPPSQRLIAGSTSGYLEGTGSDARFNNPQDATVWNRTHLLVIDSANHCLRAVDILRRTTSRYLGMCESRGNVNGDIKIARFYYPFGFFKLGEQLYYVSDEANGAVRILENDSISTLQTGYPLRSPHYFTQGADGIIYLTSRRLITKRDARSGEMQFELFSGSLQEPNYANGNLTSSRYNYLHGISHLSEHTLAGADRNNHHLRIIDLQNETVTSICTGQGANIDGDKFQCGLNGPHSLLVYKGELLVGVHKQLRRIPLYFHAKTTPIQRLDDSEEVSQIKVVVNKPIFNTEQAVLRVYRFIVEVVKELNRALTDRFINQTLLTHYGLAQTANLPYYISGEITLENDAKRIEFTYGDGMYYNGYHNVELNITSDYRLHYLFQYTLNGEVKTEIVESSQIYKPKQETEVTTNRAEEVTTDRAEEGNPDLKYLSLLSILVVVLVIIIIIVLINRRKTGQNSTDSRDERPSILELGRKTDTTESETVYSGHHYEEIDDTSHDNKSEKPKRPDSSIYDDIQVNAENSGYGMSRENYVAVFE